MNVIGFDPGIEPVNMNWLLGQMARSTGLCTDTMRRFTPPKNHAGTMVVG
jgi:hypothetical protein